MEEGESLGRRWQSHTASAGAVHAWREAVTARRSDVPDSWRKAWGAENVRMARVREL